METAVRNVGRKSFADLIAAGRYDRYVNPDITEKNFPVKPERFSTEGTKPFHFNRIITTAEIEAEIRAQGYELAWFYGDEV